MKYTLALKQSGGFSQNPRFAELEGDKILANNVLLPREIDPDAAYNPYNVRMFVIGHEFGPICAVWASSEQEALDEAVDQNMLDCLMEKDQNPEDDEDLTRLGNAGELFDLTHAWIADVEWHPLRDIKLIVCLIRASENQRDTLE